MQDFFQLGLVAISTPFVLLRLFFACFKGKKYQKYTESEFAEEFQMSQLFCVGFSVMKLFHFNTRSKKARQKIKEISEIKGKKYAEFYYYIMQGQQITYGYTILIVMILLASVAGSVVGFASGSCSGSTSGAVCGFFPERTSWMPDDRKSLWIFHRHCQSLPF